MTENESSSEFPQAEVREASDAKLLSPSTLRSTRMWWVTIVCVLVAIVLVVISMSGGGTRITVHFEEGHGIKPHDTLRYRGIDVGEVVSVKIDDELKGVDIEIVLNGQSSYLARADAHFWIERPQVGLGRLSGLDTVVGAKYVGVLLSGDSKPLRKTEFDGLETPPVLRDSAQTEITIRFEDGFNLSPGDVVKHRGIIVGEVTGVELDENLEGVQVGVRLLGSARRLAKVGSQFWIERPRLSVSEVRGLDTLVAGQYIAVLPGPPSAGTLLQFDGLERAPQGLTPEGGLEFILEGPQRWGIEPGVPIVYRGVEVGRVISVGLSSDSVGVEARAMIQPEYRTLVCENSRFWSTSGVNLEVGLLSGVQFNADTLSTIAKGGVAFATPDPPGKAVATGHRFEFAKQPTDEWLSWQPRIHVGDDLLPDGKLLPRPLRATLTWQYKYFGFTRTRQLQGWVLPLDNKSIVGPSNLFHVPSEAINDGTLEVAGKQIVIDKSRDPISKTVERFALTSTLPDAEALWPTSGFREFGEPEDCLLVADSQAQKIPLSPARLTVSQDGWVVDPSLPISPSWNGASVVAIKDGKVLGMLTIENGQRHVSRVKNSQ